VSTFSNPLTEYSPQMEFGSGPAEFQDESALGIFDEVQELELAAGLLEVANEEHLDRFLVEVIQQAEKATGSLVTPSQAQAIHDVLSNSIHQILPTAMEHGAAMRNSVGARLGSGLSAMAGQVLGLELESLSPEDREFEAVRQFVRFAGETVKKTALVSAGKDPQDVAHRAATEAAEVYAPGLFVDGPDVPASSGRWIWCGDRIILFGV